MRVAHILRKYNVAEWGGTETALERLLTGLRPHQINPVIFCPELDGAADEITGNGQVAKRARDPLAEAGGEVRRFKAYVPIWGVSPQYKRQLVSVGGNLMSFSLIHELWREKPVHVIHAHALGRLGAIGMMVARYRQLPFVVTIHGGLMDLPDKVKNLYADSAKSVGGVEWGKLCGIFLRSRQMLDYADAVITCNPREAELLQQKYPAKRIVMQPHGVPTAAYQADCRELALAAFPQLRGKRILLSVGRIDPVKNQGFLVEHIGPIFQRYPDTVLVLAGSCTDETYGQKLEQRIKQLGLTERVILTGGFPSMDPRLIGLFQQAEAVILPSLSETFGLIILECWAAGAVPVASRTSGARALIEHGKNGWLFDLEETTAFLEAMDEVLSQPAAAKQRAAEGLRIVKEQYDTGTLALRIKGLYEQLIEEKNALRNS